MTTSTFGLFFIGGFVQCFIPLVFAPGKQLTDTLVNLNFLLIMHLLMPFPMESPIIRAFLFSCLRSLLFIWSWVAAFTSDCNRLSPELLLKLSSIFSNGAYLLRSQNQCHYLFYYFYRYSFYLILILCRCNERTVDLGVNIFILSF